MEENKALICERLCEVLKLTSQCHDDLLDLDYDGELEIVTAIFASGGKRRINVALDSGWAMIKDILRGVG